MPLPPFIDNPDPKRWQRRALTIPVGLATAPIATPCILLALPVAWLYDRFAKGKSTCRALLFFCLFFWLQCIGLIRLGLSWLFWIVHRNRMRFLDSNHKIQLWWSNAFFKSMSSLMGMTFVIEGDAPDCGGSLVFVRHASVADTVLPIGLVSLPQDLRVRYVLKSELKWDPCLDIAGQRLPNAFVQRGAGQKEIERAAKLGINLDMKSAVVIYPEGTRFTPKRQAALIQRFVDKKDTRNEDRARSFQNCLPPRLGGVSALIAKAPTAPIVIMGHYGFEGAAKLSNLFNGRLGGTTVYVKFWQAPPPGVDHIAEWLDEQWHIMDEWVTSKEKSAKMTLSN